ncbi:hypothetical protein ACWFRF_25190 [Nocardia sp. NPDC055165]
MARKRTWSDPIANHVADHSVEAELIRATSATMSASELRYVLHLIRHNPENYNLRRSYGLHLARIRDDPDFGPSLAIYHSGDAALPPRAGICKQCPNPVKHPSDHLPHVTGRPREFCSNACRQQAYRNRKRAQEIIAQRTKGRSSTV